MEVRERMLNYHCNLMQDALELDWLTAKRAHAQVLTEMERGNVFWDNEGDVDRIRQRYTQRVLKQSSKPPEYSNRICKRYNESNCAESPDHCTGKYMYKHACFNCYRAVKKFYPHKESECMRGKREAAGNEKRV